MSALSPVQQRMWFLQRLVPSSGPAFNVSTATRLTGPLDTGALQRALDRLAQRHESLRTTFPAVAGRPVRSVAPHAAVALEATDGDLSTVDAVVRTALDLEHGPLMRAVLVRLAEHQHVLVLCLSHAIADGWSMGVVHRELSALYQGDLPALTYDFDTWVRDAQQRRTERHERDLVYWQQELDGAPLTLALPADRQRPAVESYAGARLRIVIPDDLRDQVAATARALGATPFAVYLAAYALALRAWSGQHDLVIGTPFANRRTIEQETLVGPLMEMLLLRLRMPGDLTAGALIRQVRMRTVQAMAHADLGFDALVQAIQPERDAGRNPLFQTMFLMQNSPLPPVTLPGCRSEPIEVLAPTARLDLAMDLTVTSGQAVATVEYNTDLFDAGLIERFGRAYQEVLRDVATNPGPTLETLVTGLQPQAPATEPDRGGLLHELVAGAPDAVAVESSTGTLTYAELARQTQVAARALRSSGVDCGDVVAVRIDRSVEQIVALLAVMAAGAAYLPLDPDHPADRAAEVCQDAGVAMSIDRQWVRTAVAASAEGELPVLDTADIAYVMYTSGSTGKPKGVMVSHRSATDMIRWAQESLPLRPGDRMLGKTPYTFDISVWEIFGPLHAGATLVLADPGAHRDAEQVAGLLADGAITVTHFVPSMLRGVLAVPDRRPWPHLRFVLAGGEVLPAELAERLTAHFTGPVYNFYGPTEATIYASWHTAGDRTTATGTVPIGRALAGCTLHVLDEHLRPVWPGAFGELFIGGTQVAAGYLNQPGLTASRFLPDPFSDRPGARMYRTGDIVRVAGDGALDFLGRRDGQVKLRGFRIELGEIEAALHALPVVTAAAAEVRADPAGDRLVAHVVGAGTLTADDLRRRLSARLPTYMIPSRFRFAAELPTTTSGKLDRRALAAVPLDGPAAPAAAGRAPAGPVEPILAAAWSAVIGVDVTDADANFFALGGDSISSVAVVGECRRRGVDVAVRDIFAHPTVADLARVARPATVDEVATAAPQPSAEQLPLGPMQQYAVDRVVRTRLPGLYVVCFTAAIDGQNFDPAAWKRTWRELMCRHGCLRTSFIRDGGGYAQVVHADPPLPFEVVDLSHLDEAAALAEVARAESAQRWHVIDITDAPQWRMLVFRIGPVRYRIICRLSYLLQDGWSVSVLQDEWFPLYEAYRTGREPDLPAPPTPYAVHLRHLAARSLEAGRAYWREQLSGIGGASAVTAALRQRCRPGGPPDHQTVPRWLTDAQEQELRSAVRREGLPLFPALQGGWAILLAEITGRPDVLFGTISSGRATPDVRQTYGSFNNMMPTPVRLDPGATVRHLLHELHQRGPDDRDNDHVPLPVIAGDAGVEAVDLLDTYIVHENFPINPRTQQRFQAWQPDIAEMRTEHSLRMLIWPVGELSLHLSFDARILSAADADILMDRYVAILGAIAEKPDQLLSNLMRDPWRDDD